MILCLVTDRRRLCADGRLDAARRCLLEQTRHAVAAGIDLVQIRERDLEASSRSRSPPKWVAMRGTATRVIVNDRLDVALAVGADGVPCALIAPPSAARRSRAGFRIGRSVHRLDEWCASRGRRLSHRRHGVSDPSKRRDTASSRGPRSIAAAVPVPVLAIGGISIERIGQIAEAEPLASRRWPVCGRRTGTVRGAAPLAGVVQPAHAV